jgi:hypothetical protein
LICSANVAPRWVGAAVALVPDVSAPESAGTVRPYRRTSANRTKGDAVTLNPFINDTTAEAIIQSNEPRIPKCSRVLRDFSGPVLVRIMVVEADGASMHAITPAGRRAAQAEGVR